MGEAKRKASSFVAEIDEAELTVRLLEIAIGMRRPSGKSARQILSEMSNMTDPAAAKTYGDMSRMARAAIGYLGECIAAGQEPS